MKQLGLILFPLTLLAGPTSAQFPQVEYEVSDTTVHRFPWPPELVNTAAFESTHFGSFFGAGSPDGAVQRGDKAYLFYHPQFHDAGIEVGSGVEDIAPVKPEQANGFWGLAMAKADGLHLYTVLDGDTNLTVDENLHAGTKDLTIVRAADLDGSGGGDLIGAYGSSVHLIEHDGTGWSATAPFTTTGAADVLDVQAVNWDHNSATDEVAVLTKSGLEIRSTTWGLLDYFAGAANAGMIAALPPMYGHDDGRVAWCYPLPGNDKLLLVCNPGGSRDNCGTFGVAPSSLSAGVFLDDSGDRRVDLCTGVEADLYLRYFEHKQTGDPYDPDDEDIEFQVGTLTPPNSGRIVFQDISADGAPDAFLGRDGDDALYFVGGLGKSLGYGTTVAVGSILPFVAPKRRKDNGDTWIIFGVELPDPPLIDNYNFLQAQLWSSPDGIDLDNPAIANHAFRITDYPPGAMPADMKIGFKLPDDCDLDGGYYVKMRVVQIDNATQNPLVPDAWLPHVTGGFTDDQPIADEMEPNALAWSVLEPCPTGGGGQQIGQPPVVAPAFVLEPRWARLPPPAVANPGDLELAPALPPGL